MRTSSGLRPTIMDHTFDVCAALLKPRASLGLLERACFGVMLADTNMDHPCPWEGAMRFRNVNITPDTVLNSFVPPGRYRTTFRFFDQRTNESIYVVHMFLHVL